MSDFPVTGKIQGNGFVPIAVGRIHRQGPAATGVVDQYIDVTDGSDGGSRQLCCGILLHDVLFYRDQRGASRRLDIMRKLLEQIFSSGDRDDTPALYRQCLGYRAANPDEIG